MITLTLTNVLTASILTAAALSAAPQITDDPYKLTNGHVSYELRDIDTEGTLAEDPYNSSFYWTALWYDATTVTNANTQAKTILAKTLEAKPTEKPVAQPTMMPTPTAVPTAVPTTAPVQTAPVNTSGVLNDAQITYLGNCEAGMDPAKNTGNGYYGAFQFSQGTWNAMNTGYARADLAPIEVQKAAVQQLLAKSSIYNQFPGCASKMRNAGII